MIRFSPRTLALMTCVLASTIALLQLQAAENTVPAPPTATTASTTSTASVPAVWLQGRGLMTADDVAKALGITPTSEQRAQIEKAVEKRNAALREANADFSKALQKTLAANDGELAKKVQEESDRQRMAKIRSRQPGRYQGMKKDKKEATGN